MGKLFQLREWLNLDDAAAHLTEALGETVDAADVLRLAIDGHFIVSVRFPNGINVRFGELKDDDGESSQHLESGDPDEPPIEIYDVRVDSDCVFRPRTEWREYFERIWDLPMLGQEKRLAEEKYQTMRGAPKFSTWPNVATLLACDEGHFDFPSFIKLTIAETDGLFREDRAEYVVRPSMLKEFVESVSAPPTARAVKPEVPLTTREQTTLLTVIGALAAEAKIDISEPSKAADQIESLTVRLGARVASRTIFGYLKQIPDAIERKTK